MKKHKRGGDCSSADYPIRHGNDGAGTRQANDKSLDPCSLACRWAGARKLGSFLMTMYLDSGNRERGYEGLFCVNIGTMDWAA